MRNELAAGAAQFARSLPTWDDAAAALIETYDELTSVRLEKEYPRAYQR